MKQSIQQLPFAGMPESEGIDVRSGLGVAWENRWLIIAIAALAALVGMVYALLATPVYEANILIQVDNNPPPAKNILNDMANPGEVKAGAASEIEVLRSRRVLSQAVDNAHLYISVEPNYFFGVGEWIARRNRQLSNPGLFGFGGYVWGAERADIGVFNVPEELEGAPFTLVAAEDGRFRLHSEELGIDIAGTAGSITGAATSYGTVEILVSRLAALPGAEFKVMRQNRLAVIERLQASLSISERGKESGVIGVRLQGTNRQLTTRALDEIGQEYIRQNEEKRAEEAEKSLVFLNKQLPSLKQELERSETEYNRLRNMHGTVDLGEEAKSLLQQSTLTQTRLIELRQKREELLTRFQPEHPEVKGIDQRLRALNRELAGLDARTKRLPAMEQDLFRLTRDVKVNTEVYTAVLSLAQQLRLLAANRAGNARLLDSAAASTRPVKPRGILVIALSGLAGLLLGGIAVYFKKAVFGKIDSPFDIERMLGIPVSATIPHSEASAIGSGPSRVTLLPYKSSSDTVIESLRGLRAAMQAAMHEAKNNIVMITGATPGVGKSFISANFSTVLASVGKRVLLIDADLRTGHLHHYFGVRRQYGLSEAIRGECSLDRLIHRNVAENLDFMPAGRLDGNPCDLLAHSRFEELLHALAARYDFILIDTAPLLAVPDALSIAPHAGTIFNVARGGVTTAREIAETVRRLNQAGYEVTGTVLNDARQEHEPYGYGGRYGGYACAAPD